MREAGCPFFFFFLDLFTCYSFHYDVYVTLGADLDRLAACIFNYSNFFMFLHP